MTGDSARESELIVYQTEDRRTRIECRRDGDTLWLTQPQTAELSQTTPQNIALKLKEIFAAAEFAEPATFKEYLQVREQSATARLSRYQVRGFAMEDKRLKHPPGPGQQDYFDELLERIPRAVDAEFEKVVKQLKNPPVPTCKWKKKR